MNFGRCSVLLFVLLAGWCAAPGLAQDAMGEKVRFSSVDGVDLQGSFYASSKRSAPTVLMLHAIGEDSHKKGWVGLAEELQKSGFSVLTFDFRGHGNSTDVQPDQFWKHGHNTNLIKGSKGKSSIHFKNFDARYHTVLVNDIAAAKAFLDRSKNDNGTCNTSSFIVIGAETGATLGALWLNSEWYRFKLNPPAMFGMQPTPDIRAEGKDTICGIWLSFSTKLAGRLISPSTLLDLPGRQGATPFVFMYSDNDVSGKATARAAEKNLKVAKDDKYRFTTAFEIKGNAKLTGAELLQKSLGTDTAIVDYLKQVVEAKSNEWAEKEFRKNQYIWRNPANPNLLLPAKFMNEQNLVWESYERFLR